MGKHLEGQVPCFALQGFVWIPLVFQVPWRLKSGFLREKDVGRVLRRGEALLCCLGGGAGSARSTLACSPWSPALHRPIWSRILDPNVESREERKNPWVGFIPPCPDQLMRAQGAEFPRWEVQRKPGRHHRPLFLWWQ